MAPRQHPLSLGGDIIRIFLGTCLQYFKFFLKGLDLALNMGYLISNRHCPSNSFLA